MKFDIKKEKCNEAFCLYPDRYFDLFRCGNNDIWIKKENKKSESWCKQNEDPYFDYRGVEKALVQKPNIGLIIENFFTVKRIIVIQMK